MTFIWTPEALESLFEHPSEDVRDWAVERAFDLYPGMQGRLASLVPSSSPRVASSILHRLADPDILLARPDPLLELLRGSVRRDLKGLSAALLLRSGYGLLNSELESIDLADYSHVLAATEEGFGMVLQLYRVSGGKNEAVFKGIADACGFSDLFRNLVETKDKKEVAKRREYLARAWCSDLPRFERLSKPEEILSLLGDALATALPEDGTPWKRGLLAELRQDRARLAALYDIANERVLNWSREESKFILACFLCLQRNQLCGDALVEATDAAGLWRALAMKPWRGVPGQALRQFLLSTKPEELLAALQSALSKEYSYAAYSFRIVNMLGIPGRFALFLDVVDGEKCEDILAEEATKALREAGAPAAQYIVEKYPQMSPELRIEILYVLDSLPVPRVVDFCLERFEDYMRGPEPEEFVGCLETIAAREFLAPLLREWREGEIEIGRAVKLIAEIHNVRTEQVERAIRDTEKRVRHPGDVLDKPVALFPLRCTQCGRTHNYELTNIYLDNKGQPIIGDIIQCKACGSIETYEMTVHAQLRVTTELVRLAALREARGNLADTSGTPLKFYDRVHIRTLGREVKSIGEAYRILKGEIEGRPQDADLQKRMGNVLKNGGKPELALPFYLEAIKLNPNDAESHYSIADILIDQGKYDEATPHLEALVPLCREDKMDEGLRRGIFSALLHHSGTMQEKTGHKIELFRVAKPEDMSQAREVTLEAHSFDPSRPEDFEWLYHTFRYGRAPKGATKPDLTIEANRPQELALRSSAVRSDKKIGRNDPCPCGSGKKYKKCCGR